MIDKHHIRYFFVILFIVVLYLSFLVIKPFLNAIIISMVFAFIFYPIYNWIRKKINNRTAAALIIALIFVLVVSIPAFFLVDKAINEAQVFYSVTRQKFISGEFLPVECSATDKTTICRFSGLLKKLVSDAQFKFYINEALKNVTKFIITSAQNFFLSIPRIILSLFIIIFTTFYFIRDGDILVKKAKNLLPLKKKHQNDIMKQFKDVTHGIIYGHILLSLLQGLIGGLAFAYVGISSPIIWGLVMTILALIPAIGTTIIWVPAILIKFAGSEINSAIIILISGIIMFTIDNFYRPKIIGKKAKIHPIIILIGVLGGLFMFGIVGFLIGPLILALFLTFLKIYETEKSEAKS